MAPDHYIPNTISQLKRGELIATGSVLIFLLRFFIKGKTERLAQKQEIELP